MRLQEMLPPLAALAVCGLLGSFSLLTGKKLSNGVGADPAGGGAVQAAGLVANQKSRPRTASLDEAMAALDSARQRERNRLAGGVARAEPPRLENAAAEARLRNTGGGGTGGGVNGDGATSPPEADTGPATKSGLRVGFLSAVQRRDKEGYCDEPHPPFTKFVGRCYKGLSTGKRDQLNAMMAVNHACYTAANSFELVLDSTDYVGDLNLTMTPTVRNQQHKGDPVDPDDPHYAEQVATMPDRVPVPPYWNKVFALKKHIERFDWLVWMDNDMWFTNMTIDIADVLTRVPGETFMLVPFGDVNSIFFLRNSVQGRAFLDRWLKMGIEDGGAPCKHKFGCWEYHDQGWWFASMIESIQAHNGVPNECYNKCQIKSLWTCFISYAKQTLGIPLQLHTATSSQAVTVSWPTVASVVGPWPPQAGWVSPYRKGEAPPVAIVESEHYRWLARNLAWGGRGRTFDQIAAGFTVHVKDPTIVTLRGSGDLYGNCYRHQHNYCLAKMKCQAAFDAEGRLQAGCGDAAPVPNAGISPEPLPYFDEHGVDGCDKGGEFQCECWGCTCQGASDGFGIAHGNKGSMEGVPPDVQTYWIDGRCRTTPEAYSGTMLKLKKRPFDKAVCPMIGPGHPRQ